MMSSLHLLKVRNNRPADSRFADLPSELMMPPFRLLVNAPSGSGKSTMVQNLLWRREFYKDRFDMIYYLSPTIFEDTTAEHMHAMQDSRLVLSDQVDKLDILIQNLIERQSSNEYQGDHVLLVLDDCVGLIRRGSMINTFIMKCRHYRISVIMVTQYYRGVDPKLRENSSSYIFYKNANATEVRKIVDEIGGRFPDFKMYYDYATEVPYNFLYVNGNRLYRNFSELIYDGDNIR